MKFFIVLIIILLFTIGIFLVLNIRVKDIISFSKKSTQSIKRKKSLKTIIESHKTKHKTHKFFITREISNTKTIFKESRKQKGFIRMVIACIVLTTAGFMSSVIFLHNWYAAPFIGLLGFFAPVWKQQMYVNKYDKYIDMQLESAVSLITTSYMRKNDIIQSVQENVNNFDIIVRKPFEEFIAEAKINPNITDCIRNLQNKFDNNIFYEWCDVLQKTYEDSEIKENLVTVSKKFSTVRIIQHDLDTQTSSVLSSYIILMLVSVCIYPLVYIVNKEWFFMYLTETAGKISIAITCAVVFYAISKLISLLKPVKFER